MQHNDVKEKLELVLRSPQMRLKPFSPKLANIKIYKSFIYHHKLRYTRSIVKQVFFHEAIFDLKILVRSFTMNLNQTICCEIGPPDSFHLIL